MAGDIVVVAVAAMVVAAAGPPQPPERPVQHRRADQRDRAVAGDLEEVHLVDRAAEGLLQDEMDDDHDDDGRDDVKEGDLRAHQDAAADLRVLRQEIGEQHGLAMPRADGVEHPIGKGDRQSEQQRGQRMLALDGDQPVVDGAVDLALQCHESAGDPREERGRCRVALRRLAIGRRPGQLGPGRRRQGQERKQRDQQQRAGRGDPRAGHGPSHRTPP